MFTIYNTCNVHKILTIDREITRKQNNAKIICLNFTQDKLFGLHSNHCFTFISMHALAIVGRKYTLKMLTKITILIISKDHDTNILYHDNYIAKR